MGFWIFMLIMDLLLPFTMIGFGRYFMKKAPKEINSVFGYFFEWLDLLLKNELSSEIKAIIFNLYEDTDNKWSIELVGTFSFNKDNDDWA